MRSLWREDFPKGTNPLRFFLFASRPHWKPATVGIISVVVASILYSGIAYIFKLITDAVAALPEGGYSTVMWAGAWYILVLFAAQSIWRISGYAGAQWATGVRATARHSLTAYVTLHSRAYFSSRFAGSISNKIGHAGSGARDMVEQFLWQFLELFVSVLASFVIAFVASPILAWIFLGWVLVIAAINVVFARKRVPLASRSQKLENALTGMTVDLLSNISAMQEYARRPFEIKRLKQTIEARRTAGLRNWYFGEHMLTVNGLIQALFGGAMAFLAVSLAQQGSISAGDIILILTIIFRIDGLLLFLGSHLNKFSETWGEIHESLEEVLSPHEIPDTADARELVVSRGEIAIEHLTFNYPEMPVFKNLSLRIASGERVGLVGRSGAGKSTLIRLLLHHHDLDSGRITIDGTDIAAVTQESLRNAISVVPQEPLLFHRTVAENISYGKPEATREEIVYAAGLAQADGFIRHIPSGYDALVGERGVKLSGGERQRIAIARAILKDAPILLLDEATSALDSESEVAIQTALHKLMEGKTVIAIAHRLSTLREMDRIIVLDQGQIVEDGAHDELLKAGGMYAELWGHQAGGFLQDEE